MLSKPTLALTKDRTQKAQLNTICGDPEAWFDSDAFRTYNLYAASFDFFVDWTQEKICDEVWIKRMSDSADIRHLSEEELLGLIAECDGKEKANSLYCFLKAWRMKQKYMLFRDVPEAKWKDGTEKVVEVDMTKYQKGAVSYLDVNEIQMRIQKLRKVPAPIGNAGLIYSTSSLEGYLSRQEYFWPGDADTVLYDGDYHVAAVIEFKKHTASSRISFQNQGIRNYLARDILKYKSLALLRDLFHTRLFVVYYPIPQNIRYVIVEELKGSPGFLYAGKRVELDLPVWGDAETRKAFAGEFINQVLKDGRKGAEKWQTE